MPVLLLQAAQLGCRRAQPGVGLAAIDEADIAAAPAPAPVASLAQAQPEDAPPLTCTRSGAMAALSQGTFIRLQERR